MKVFKYISFHMSGFRGMVRYLDYGRRDFSLPSLFLVCIFHLPSPLPAEAVPRISLEMRVWVISHVPLFVTPWTVALQASLVRGISSQDHWSELPFPPPGDLLDQGIEPTSPTETSRKTPYSPKLSQG